MFARSSSPAGRASHRATRRSRPSRPCSTSDSRASASCSGCSRTRRSARRPCSRARRWGSVRAGSSCRCRVHPTRVASRWRSCSSRSCRISCARSAAEYTEAHILDGRHSMRRTGHPARLIALALIATLTASVGPLAAQTTTAPATGTAPAAVPPELARFNQLLADLADRLKPALVHIRVRRANASKEDESEPGDPRRSTGSGFVIDPGGTLVTAAHVVEDANWIQVRTFDGRRYTARLLGQDRRVDLAVLKIEAAGLPVLTFGDANRLRVGEFVMALGHPFGLEHSVSFGIVS